MHIKESLSLARVIDLADNGFFPCEGIFGNFPGFTEATSIKVHELSVGRRIGIHGHIGVVQDITTTDNPMVVRFQVLVVQHNETVNLTLKLTDTVNSSIQN